MLANVFIKSTPQFISQGNKQVLQSNKQLLITHNVPGTVKNSTYVLDHLILMVILWGHIIIIIYILRMRKTKLKHLEQLEYLL